VIADISVSLDGDSAGPNVAIENPMDDGGEGLHTWMWFEAGRMGRNGTAVEGPQELLAYAGAVVVGRRMFDLSEEPWADPPPFHDNLVFLVTHRAYAPIVKSGGTTYTFVTEGLEAALARLHDAADDLDVAVVAGRPSSSSASGAACSTSCGFTSSTPCSAAARHCSGRSTPPAWRWSESG
jgi:dihydrofolate reductase